MANPGPQFVPLPAPLTLPELDAIRGQDENLYRCLRSMMEQMNSIVNYDKQWAGRGVAQSAGPMNPAARGTNGSVTLYWTTRGDGSTPTFYQIWRKSAGTVSAPQTPTFDNATRIARVPAEIFTPFIVNNRHIWTDADFTADDLANGVMYGYWVTSVDVQGNESLPVYFGAHAGGECCGGGGGASPEILIIADTSVTDVTVTLPDPTTFADPATVVNVKNWAGGINELHIAPGVLGTIDGVADGIRTRTNNQGYRFRDGATADSGPVSGWVCIETIFGGDSGGGTEPLPPPVTPTCDPGFDTSSALDVQSFSGGSFTWAKPLGFGPGRKYLVKGIAAGGSGSGAEAATCGGDTTYAGGGAGGGQFGCGTGNLDDLPNTVPVNAPAGPAGGTGGGVSGTVSPTPGNDGGDFEFGTGTDPYYVTGAGGKRGELGSCNPTVGDGGLGGGGTAQGASGTGYNGGGGGQGSAPGMDGGSAPRGGGGGGGGGGSDTTFHGRDGGKGSGVTAGGTGSGSSLANGGDGDPGASGDIDNPGKGGGGGGGSSPASGSFHGGKGGAGGFPGGGGGGGGGMGNSALLGGDGGPGGGALVVVYVF